MRGDGASNLDTVQDLPSAAPTSPMGEIVPLPAAQGLEPANDVGREPFSAIYSTPVGGWAKRGFDICFAASALAVLSPLLLLIALAIRLDSQGPAVFRQERGGFGGKRFRIWKYRTMRVVEDGAQVRQAVRDDDRITRVGAFLRKTSLDEFPQLVNVLIGDMSLVGPRPHAVVHDEEFVAVDPRYPLRAHARPGMTGLAQVFGCRGPTKTGEAIRRRTGWDVDYVKHWSFGHDMKILARTAVVMLKDPHAF